MYACVYRPPAPDASGSPLSAIAEQFSPRYECDGADLVTIDVSGLDRLLGPAQTIADELRREASSRGVGAHVAVAATRIAAMVAPSNEDAIVKKLYPDQSKFSKEEQRRFEILDAHWDVPLNELDLEPRASAGR